MKIFIVTLLLASLSSVALAQSEEKEDEAFKRLNELKKIVPKSKFQKASLQKHIDEEMERLRKEGKLKVKEPR